MVKRKRKAPPKPESPREWLGLDSAEAGKASGVARWLYFIQHECSNLYHFTNLPEPIRLRLKSLSKEAGNLLEFTNGYIAGSEKK